MPVRIWVGVAAAASFAAAAQAGPDRLANNRTAMIAVRIAMSVTSRMKRSSASAMGNGYSAKSHLSIIGSVMADPAHLESPRSTPVHGVYRQCQVRVCQRHAQ